MASLPLADRKRGRAHLPKRPQMTVVTGCQLCQLRSRDHRPHLEEVASLKLQLASLRGLLRAGKAKEEAEELIVVAEVVAVVAGAVEASQTLQLVARLRHRSCYVQISSVLIWATIYRSISMP